MNIIEAINSDKIFRPLFKDLGTWNSWLVFLKSLFALPMADRKEKRIYKKHTGRKRLPGSPFKSAFVISGRRSGKSRISSLIGCYLALFRDWSEYLAPGERGYIFVIANDKPQADTIFRYIQAILHFQKSFEKLIERETVDEIHLNNNISIAVKSCQFRTLRGYTVLAAILEEIAFYRDENYSNPASEIIRSLRPSLITIPESLLIGISTGYGRFGFLYQEYKDHYGENSNVLVWQSSSLEMNPTLDKEEIKRAYLADPSSARSEWGGEFRDDLEEFLPLSLIESAVIKDRFELLPQPGIRYFGFVDPSGGRQDSMTLAISHQDKKSRKIIIDNLMEARPPFQPESIVRQFSLIFKRYGISQITGDRYAGEWVTSAFRNQEILFENSELNKSEIYLSFLPLMSNHNIELLNSKRLVAQLRSLERRTRSGGRDSVDHAPGGHDDLANAVTGSCVLTWTESNIEPLPFIRSRRIKPPLNDEERMAEDSKNWLLSDGIDEDIRKLEEKIYSDSPRDEEGNLISEDDLEDNYDLNDFELDALDRRREMKAKLERLKKIKEKAK